MEGGTACDASMQAEGEVSTGSSRQLCTRGTLAIFGNTFGINHAAVTTPVLYQSLFLGSSLGNDDNAVLYAATLLTSLFLSVPLLRGLGPRTALTISMLGYSSNSITFALALIAKGWRRKALAIVGSFVGGLAAGLQWTAQGVIYARICADVAKLSGRPAAEVTAALAGRFGLYYLIWEAATRAFYTVCARSFDWDSSSGDLMGPAVLMLSYGGVAALAALVFWQGTPSSLNEVEPRIISLGRCGHAGEAIRLWKHGRLWSLQFTNLTFGFAAAWSASHIGPMFIAQALGANAIGLAGAVVSLVGGLGARSLSRVSRRVGKGPVLALGAAAYFTLGLLSKLLPDGSSLGWHVLVFPCLQGIGRAVYESTNKGVFADFFPGPRSIGAFANVALFSTVSSTIVFLLDSQHLSDYVIYLLLSSAVLTWPGFLWASFLFRRDPQTLSELHEELQS